MRAIKPKKLKKGELVGVISPASSAEDNLSIESGVKYLEGNGYRVEVGKNVGKIHGYLAGSDGERLNDLHYMFSKKEIKAIFCVRGGYGSGRLLADVNYKLIKNNPKILVGYSDITALQMAIAQKTGLITFAGPMLSVDFNNDVSPFTEEIFWKLITSNKKIGKVHLPGEEKLFQLHKGQAKGRIIGGNLSVFNSLIGTPFLPELKDKILLLEEIGEMPYRIDRMLNQLKMNKVFSKVKGIILGAFRDCNELDPMKRTLSLGEVITEYLKNLKIPVIYNFKHGHIKDFITIPLGLMVKINASKEVVEFTESAVS